MTPFWYMANEVTYYKKAELESYLYPMYSIGFFWDESVDRYNYMEMERLQSYILIVIPELRRTML